MSTIDPIYRAHIVVSQAEVKFVADETANEDTATIKSDQQRIEAAQEVEQRRRRPSIWISLPETGASVGPRFTSGSPPIATVERSFALGADSADMGSGATGTRRAARP
jgi:hypothetical protein